MITHIIEYVKRRTYELQHRWFSHSIFSICTNGVLYDDPRLQELIRRYRTQLDIGITIDGTKRMHDAARLFPDGSGSYDRIIKNRIPLWQEQFPNTGTKATISHENLPFVAEAILHLFDIGISTVHANVVFENVWQPGDDELFERQLDILGDAIIERRIWETQAANGLARHPDTGSTAGHGSHVHRQSPKRWVVSEAFLHAPPDGRAHCPP